jgi:serine protease DegQ
VPVSTAKQVMESIIASGQVIRGYLGVELQDITPEMAEALKLSRTSGAMIAGVPSKGPAVKTGLKLGDIVVSVEDQAVTDTTSMRNLIALLKPGSTAKLKVIRGDKELELVVNVAKRPKPVATPQE